MAERDALGVTMRFEVVIDGVDLGGWATCQGLAVEFNPEAVRELGENETVQYLPGVVSYPKIVLTRAMTAEDSAKVRSWLAAKVGDATPGTASIVLRDAKRRQVAKWDLRNVLPARWTGPTLDAGTSRVAIETLELVHEGFL